MRPAPAACAVMEEIMLGMMYELPDLDARGSEFVIDHLRGAGADPPVQLRVARKESA